jgi:chondroitin 4-sulfotransferase 11
MVSLNPIPFIFVHIPKCAGTSIEKALIPIISHHKDFRDFSEQEKSEFWLPRKDGLQHSELTLYEQHYDLREYFKFCFVRNPWDRAVSQITYLKYLTGVTIFHKNKFKDNLYIYCNSQQKIYGHDLGACQLDYLRTISGKIHMDFIGRFETLRHDFQKVSALLGLKSVPNLPHLLNTRRREHYSTFYDAESSEWVRSRFQKDIDFFGYEFVKITST